MSEAAGSAAAGPGLPSSITNSPSKGAYPIATFTWLVFPEAISDTGKKAAFLDLLRWILTDGQNECSALAYAPLPRDLASRQLQLLNDMH